MTGRSVCRKQQDFVYNVEPRIMGVFFLDNPGLAITTLAGDESDEIGSRKSEVGKRWAVGGLPYLNACVRARVWVGRRKMVNC